MGCPICLHELPPQAGVQRFSCRHLVCASCDVDLRRHGLTACPLCRSGTTAWQSGDPLFGHFVFIAPPHMQYLLGLHIITQPIMEWRLGFLPGSLPRPPSIPGLTICTVDSRADAERLWGSAPPDYTAQRIAELLERQEVSVAAAPVHALLPRGPDR